MISLSHYRSFRLAAGLFALCAASHCVSGENAPVALPYESDFESADGYVSGPVLSDPDWNLDSDLSAEILPFGALGSQSLSFTGNQWLWLNSGGLADGAITWIDFYLKPVFVESFDLPVEIGSGQSAVTGFVKVDPAEGEVYAVDGDGLGSGQWLPSGGRTSLFGNTSQGWVRLTYRLDYAGKRWDLFVDGQMAMTDLGFLDNTVVKLTEFAARGDADDTSVLDYFYAGGGNPLYEDTSNDGLPDVWLLAQGLDVLVNQRGGDGDGDGLDNLTEYKLSTRADLSDTDGDGADDGAELAAGIDPNDPDTDDDGAQDGAELTLGIDPLDPDTDFDGAQDGPEITNGTDPLLFDTDGDGLADSLEPVWALDPLAADASLANLTETASGSGIFAWNQSLETGEGFVDGPLSGQQGWSALGDVVVAAGQVDMTDSLTGDASFERLAGTGETRRIWISFRARLPAGELPELTTLTEPAVAVWGAGNPYSLSVWDEASQQWAAYDCPADVTEWNDYALYLDYVAQEWLLTQNGVLIAGELPFRDDDLIVFSRFKALQGSVPGGDPAAERAVASFDDFVFSTAEPEGLDYDGDGLANTTESQLGSDPLATDSDGDGIDDGYEYLHGLDLLADDAEEDTDADGISNLDEYTFGLNPQLSDIDGADGIVRRDAWTGIGGDAVVELTELSDFPLNPDERRLADALDFRQATNFGDNYGQRLYGLIIAPETADYTFWIAGDHSCELWLSTDESPSNRERIAHLETKVVYREWAVATTQRSAPIALEAGQAYYFEVLHTEIQGVDHISVAWQFGSEPQEVITGAHLRAHTLEVGDSDQDGLPDAWELANGLDPAQGYGINGYAGDLDGDGILNYRERQLGTRADLSDTDGDGYSDPEELQQIFSDPTVADLNSTPVVVSTVTGASYSSLRGTWVTGGSELYSIDSTGSVGYTLNFAAAGAYRLVVEITEQNAYKSNSSTFELRGSLDGSSYGIYSASVAHGETAELSYYLPYLSAGTYTFDLDWLNGFGDSFLRIKAIRVEQIDSVDVNQNGIADWIENRASINGSDAELPLEIYASPFCFEGTSFAPAAVAIGSHPATDPAAVREESVRQSLARSYYADIELLADEDRIILIDDQSGLRTSQHTLTWAAFNAVVHDFHHIRLNDSMLLTAIDDTLLQARPIELQLTAPDGSVETHTLAAEARLQALFDQAGDWQLEATLLPLVDEAPVIYDSLIRVSSANLEPAPIIVEETARDWAPSVSDAWVEFESDSVVVLNEDSPGTMPRHFTINSRMGPSYILARLPDGGAIIDVTESKVIRDYSRNETHNQIVETFPDGTVMVSAYIILNEVPDNLSIDIQVFKSGVTFDDGSLWRTITSEDFDEQGRYQFFMLRSPGVKGGNCHRYWYIQEGLQIGYSG